MQFINEIKPTIIQARNKKQRIRTIFIKQRSLQKHSGLSDIVLLNSIVEAIIELKLPYSKNEIYSAFKSIRKDEYERSDKKMLLKNLSRKAKTKSIFNNGITLPILKTSFSVSEK